MDEKQYIALVDGVKTYKKTFNDLEKIKDENFNVDVNYEKSSIIVEVKDEEDIRQTKFKILSIFYKIDNLMEQPLFLLNEKSDLMIVIFVNDVHNLFKVLKNIFLLDKLLLEHNQSKINDFLQEKEITLSCIDKRNFMIHYDGETSTYDDLVFCEFFSTEEEFSDNDDTIVKFKTNPSFYESILDYFEMNCMKELNYKISNDKTTIILYNSFISHKGHMVDIPSEIFDVKLKLLQTDNKDSYNCFILHKKLNIIFCINDHGDLNHDITFFLEHFLDILFAVTSNLENLGDNVEYVSAEINGEVISCIPISLEMRVFINDAKEKENNYDNAEIINKIKFDA